MLKQHLLAVNSELERAYEEMETANAALQREINERKLAEELARQAHAENERLLAAIPSILIGLDGDGTVAKWNKVAEEVFAIPCPKVRGRPFDTTGIAWEDKSIIEHVLASRHQPELLRAARGARAAP